MISVPCERGRGSALDRAFLAEMQAALMSERDAICRRRHDLAIEHCADDVENAVAQEARDRAALDADRDARRLAAIVAALNRVQRGAYGICLECEEPIPQKRLRAVPAAECCRSCAEAQEAREKARATGHAGLEDVA